jgi:RNA polymerase sigma-70 factor (ECF subfamily)
MTDASRNRSLVDRLCAREEDAVRELDASFGSRIYRLAYRYLRNREDAEEVCQDVLVKVVQRICAFRGESALSSWIYRITFNATMSRLRLGGSSAEALAARAEGRRDEDGGTAGRTRGGTLRRALRDPADWAALGDEAVFRREFRRHLARALAELPPVYRAPVLLRDIQGLSTEEASLLLRVKPQTFKSRLHRGRVVLRRKLDAFAAGLSLH